MNAHSCSAANWKKMIQQRDAIESKKNIIYLRISTYANVHWSSVFLRSTSFSLVLPVSPTQYKKKPHILVDIQPASSTECTDVVPRQCSSAEKRFHWISSSIYEQRGNQQSAEWHSLSFGVWGISFQHVDSRGTATSWYKTMATARVFFLFSIRLAASVVAAANHVPPSYPNRLHPPLSHLLTSCPLSLLP